MVKKTIISSLVAIVVIVLVNTIFSNFHTRFDLTQDQRYTLSPISDNIVAAAENPVFIDIFLDGDLPADFKKLRAETKQILEEYEDKNPNIKYAFFNPIPDGSQPETVVQNFAEQGMSPGQVEVRANGKTSQQLIFPYALATYGDRTVTIPLLKKKLGATTSELISRSTQNLEYAFTEAFFRLINGRNKRIAILKGNGELPDRNIADFLGTLRDNYFIAPFPLDSIADKPTETIRALQNFDLIIAAKPTRAFSDAQKFALDQFVMTGGKSLWLLDKVQMETDSLYQNDGTALAVARDLNLDDMFFKYGIRINPQLVSDLYSAPIVLASGEGAQSKYRQLPWFYYPLVTPEENHPINTNMDNPVRFAYANPIDLLNNEVNKTVLLHSSQLTRLEGVPTPISLNAVTTEPDPRQFASAGQPLAVLLEGNFTSAFKNRILPDEANGIRFRESATDTTAMIVIADGDLIKNELDQNGRPLELGFDRFTFTQYGNKEFLLNAVNFLLDDNGLINIRNKTINLPTLDAQKATSDRRTWQALMIGLPLLLLGIFGMAFILLRNRRYT
ncbi:MAG: gliding motility-associated ABC transporter substrate-binding protein GldG [Leeuwenhoekiella sp.]